MTDAPVTVDTRTGDNVVNEAAPAYNACGTPQIMPTGFMRDTDLETQRKYYAMLKEMPAEKRMARAQQLSRNARESSIAAIRRAHPGYTESEVRRDYLRIILSATEFQVFYPEHR